jgi:lysophospholipase L1-like esterase
MIWATSTPLYTPTKEEPMTKWEKISHPIDDYNAAAIEIVKKHKIPVNDLHKIIIDNDYLKCLKFDGCHMEEFGNEVLADTIVQAIEKEL